MSKVIRILTTGIDLVDFPETGSDHDRLHWMYEQIGCTCIETVPTYRFDERYIMVVDEEGKLHRSDFNPIASWLYGPRDEIVGDALLMILRPTEEGPDLWGMEKTEAVEVLRTIGDLITRIK